MTRAARRRAIAALLGAVATIAGCKTGPAPAPDPAPRDGGAAASASIAYALAWSWEGARWDEGRRAYVFRTDRGYEVALEAAYVGVASLELVPCRTAGAAGLGDRVLALLAPAEAWANHGYVHDASLLAAMVRDSPFDARPRDAGAVVAPARAYCRLHELLAPLASGPTSSAYVRGAFTSPSGGAPRPFEGRVGLRGGALVELPGEPLLVDGSLVITVVRAPARAFDGAALESLSPSETAYAFLRGLAKATRVDVARRAPPP